MAFSTTGRVAALVAAAAITTALAQPAEAAGLGHWQAELLAMPDGYPDATGWVRGTDSHGGYAGNLLLDGVSHVVTWSAGQPTVHPQPDGFESATVVDENSAGTVLGNAAAGTWSQPYLLDHGGYELLLAPGDWSRLGAVALNERGDVLGNATTTSGDDAVLLWRAADRAHPEVITGRPYMHPSDIDDDGTILVNSFPNSFLWRDGVFQQLTAPPGAAFLSAQGIRNGQVTGQYREPDQFHGEAVRWRSPGQPEVLPSSSSASGINRFGLIVGNGTKPDLLGPPGPLSTWIEGRPMGPLPLAGFAAGAAKAVGDDGTIAGEVSDRDPEAYSGRPAVWRYFLR